VIMVWLDGSCDYILLISAVGYPLSSHLPAFKRPCVCVCACVRAVEALVSVVEVLYMVRGDTCNRVLRGT
jgi:hypothetical protein